MLILTQLLFSLPFAQQEPQTIEFITPKVIQHGEFKEGEVITGTIRFRNISHRKIQIKHISPSCGCTAAQPGKEEYAPGETAEVKYALNTSGFEGQIRKQIVVYLQNADIPALVFFLEAHIIPEIEISPRYFSFYLNMFSPDTIVTSSLEIHNGSDTPIEIKRIQTSSDKIQVYPEKTIIPSHSSYSFTVRIHPWGLKHQTGEILIDSSHPQRTEIKIPIFTKIAGG